MRLVDRLGDPTIARLERAMLRRFAEANYLNEGRFHLIAIYLYGYVIEIAIEAAYFKMLRFRSTEPIDKTTLTDKLKAARAKSRMVNDAHPVDGFGFLLIQGRDSGLHGPPLDPNVKRHVEQYCLLVRDNWEPRLRYSGMDAPENRAREIREAAAWFVKNYPKL